MNENLKNKFVRDPDWREVEKIILSYIEPLLDMTTIDITQSAETIKAEVIGRRMANEQLSKFLLDSGLIQRQSDNKTTFK